MVEIARQDIAEFRRQLERPGMAHLEGGGIIHPLGLGLDGIDYFLPPMAGIDAPHAGYAIDHLAAIVGGVMHVFRANQHARRGLELPVRRKRHPVWR